MARSSGAGSGRRERGQAPRTHVVKVKLSDSEKTTLEEAAGRAGLAVAAFIGKAGLDRATHQMAPVG